MNEDGGSGGDPINAVTLKERRQMVKEFALSRKKSKPAYDYLVPTPETVENEYVVTPTRGAATPRSKEGRFSKLWGRRGRLVASDRVDDSREMKDPMNAVSLKERSHKVKEFELSRRESKTAYDYLVPTPDMTENEMKDPMNAVTLKERRRINMKIDALNLEGEGEQNEEATELNEDANDYLVPTPDMIEKEALATDESEGSPMNAVTITEQSRQDASIELQEQHNMFNAVGERFVVNVRAVVTKE